MDYLGPILINGSCYDPKLGLDYNLSKDLRKNKKNDQLLKHKNIELYLLLCTMKKCTISISNTMRRKWGKHDEASFTWDNNWYNMRNNWDIINHSKYKLRIEQIPIYI